jgi:hypothetical protein
MDWLNILGQVFEILVFPALIAAAGYFVTWIHAKKEELKAKTKNDTIDKYIDMLDVTISECVLATTQTYVDTLKKEGKFDGEAQKVAFQKTFDAVMSVLTEDAKEYLSTATNDLTAYITNKIEASVKTTK